MPLMPKRVKYRKNPAWQPRRERLAQSQDRLRGIRTSNPRASLDHKYPNRSRARRHDPQYETQGQALDSHLPDKSVTARPPETRMGKGKGNPEHWVAVVRPGNVLFELDGVSESIARESLRLAANKLPVRTRFLSRHHAAK